MNTGFVILGLDQDKRGEVVGRQAFARRMARDPKVVILGLDPRIQQQGYF